jgi:hypothetical protein
MPVMIMMVRDPLVAGAPRLGRCGRVGGQDDADRGQHHPAADAPAYPGQGREGRGLPVHGKRCRERGRQPQEEFLGSLSKRTAKGRYGNLDEDRTLSTPRQLTFCPPDDACRAQAAASPGETRITVYLPGLGGLCTRGRVEAGAGYTYSGLASLLVDLFLMWHCANDAGRKRRTSIS